MEGFVGMKNCRICPRECGADRTAAGSGACRAPAQIIIARAALHHWEEPCISGSAGSGAVFFSGCGLGCIYCQNAAISGAKTVSSSDNKRLPGIIVTEEELADIFLRLQDEDGANNINLVTAAHYVPQTVHALEMARARGLRIPVIYNSGGYEKASTLRMLDGLVDVYLPDFKYISRQSALEYSHSPDYPDIAMAAIEEMVRQAGEPVFEPEKESVRPGEADEPSNAGAREDACGSGKAVSPGETDEPSNAGAREDACGSTKAIGHEGVMLIKKGVIVRHLLLPGHVSEAKKIIEYLHGTYGNSIYLSIMNQYTPMPHMKEHPLLSRRTTKREYERLIGYAIEIGVENGFIQEGGTAKESFIPSWNGEGVRRNTQERTNRAAKESYIPSWNGEGARRNTK